MGLSQSALVSVRGPPGHFQKASTLMWSCRMTVPVLWQMAGGEETDHSILYAGAVRWPRLVSAASSVQ
jgi:hypothetical protein